MGKISRSRILKSDGTPVVIRVASTADVYTKSYRLGDGSNFAVSMKAHGTGTPDLDIYLEQTHLDPELTAEGNANSTGEGVAGDVYNGWAAPVGSSKLADIIADNTWYHFVISPLALPFLRFKFDGQGSNPADCDVETWISQKEDHA